MYLSGGVSLGKFILFFSFGLIIVFDVFSLHYERHFTLSYPSLNYCGNELNLFVQTIGSGRCFAVGVSTEDFMK
jgi:hypothetical protein